MKKTNILATLMLGLVFVLTACTGASPSGTESPDLTGVPELPGAPAEPGPLETPMATEEGETPVETEAVETPSVTEEVTATESLPSTGMIDAGLVSNLLEFGVFSQDGERIGDAEDLVLDIENMELAYLVLTTGQFKK
jgi:hypothetical protein